MAIDKKELKKHVKALNRLLKKKINIKSDVEDLLEDFMSAIEKMDDDGKLGKIPDEILDFYEDQVPDTKKKADDDDDDADDFDADELTEELEEMSLKEVKAFVKKNDLGIKVTKKNLDEKIEEIVEAMEEKSSDGEEEEEDDDEADAGEFDADELTEELEEMSLKELKAFIKENDLGIKVTKKNMEDKVEEIVEAMEEKSGAEEDDDDDADDEAEEFDADALTEELEDMSLKEVKAFVKENNLKIKVTKKNLDDKIEEIVEAMEEKSGDEDEDEKKGKKGKGKDKGGDDYPKGMRRDSIPARIYDAIREGATIHEIAKPIAKEKKKEPSQLYGLVMRNLIRNIGKSCTVVLTTDGSGTDGGVIATLGD